jgi:hypothetical protein
MTWSYDPEMGTTKDEVRFLIGDTDPEDPLLQNEEIAYLLTVEGSPALAAARACDVLGTRFAKLVDKAVGDLRLSLSQRSENFRAQATHLRSGGASSVVPVPIATGIGIADKQAAELEEDRVAPHIVTGAHDFPGTEYDRKRTLEESPD